MMAAYTRGVEKWLGTGYILKVELRGFADGLLMKCRRREESKMMPRFKARKTNWKDRVFIN